MRQDLVTKIWQEAKIEAFWDRPKMTYDSWKSSIVDEDSRSNDLVKQSMLYMNSISFVELIGNELFIKKYPAWRVMIQDDFSNRGDLKRTLLDSQWSVLACDVALVKNPTLAWFDLTKKQRETFRCIADHGFESIYQVAKRMRRNYRRVFDDVKKLLSIGLIQSREIVRNGKKTTIVAV